MTTQQLMDAMPAQVHIKGEFATGKVHVNGQLLDPYESQKLRNHSPDGFKWGYGGSGPAQFALALLITYLPVDVALQYYQEFKFGYIAGLPQKDIDVHINLKWVMQTIFELGPFKAVKQTTRQ